MKLELRVTAVCVLLVLLGYTAVAGQDSDEQQTEPAPVAADIPDAQPASEGDAWSAPEGESQQPPPEGEAYPEEPASAEQRVLMEDSGSGDGGSDTSAIPDGQTPVEASVSCIL